jgi:hypothetical protein
MNYLLYIERSAENLQFFLWYREYVKRFAGAKTSDLALAPEWTQAMEDDAIARIKKEQAEKARKPPKEAADMFKGTDFERKITSPPQTPSDPDYTPDFDTSKRASYRTRAVQAFSSAGIKAPCKRPPPPPFSRFPNLPPLSSHDPAFPARNRPRHSNLPHRLCATATEPVRP